MAVAPHRRRDARARTRGPGPDRLRPTASGRQFTGRRRTLRGSQLCGLDSGAWCADGRSPDLAPTSDEKTACRSPGTRSRWPEPLAILGRRTAVLELAADRPQALVCVRLCDVAPDGTSLLVARGLLNLTHRDDHESPRPLGPGDPYTVTVQLDAIGHRFRGRAPSRLAVSPTLLAAGMALTGAGRVRRSSADSSASSSPGPSHGRRCGAPRARSAASIRDPTLQAGVGRRSIDRRSRLRTRDLHFDWDSAAACCSRRRASSSSRPPPTVTRSPKATRCPRGRSTSSSSPSAAEPTGTSAVSPVDR